jgi:hypothetical protein
VLARQGGAVAAVALMTARNVDAPQRRRTALLTVPAKTALAASDALLIRTVAVTVGIIPPVVTGVHEWNFLGCPIEEIATEEKP